MKLNYLFTLLMAFLITLPSMAQESDDDAAWEWDAEDPRIGLAAGVHDAGEAILNLEKLASLPRAPGFSLEDEQESGGRMSNTDLAFRDNYVFVGNYAGINVYDISDPANPSLEVSIVCPGGQGDVSVHGNLLFMSAQETRGRLDCGASGVEQEVSEERFRGVRIFDIENIREPRQVAAIQTCRGSHTHSLVSDLANPERIFVYVSGTSPVRPGEELDGCSGAEPGDDPNTSYFRIEVIEVPLDSPQDSRVVNEPRIFEVDGNIAGLWEGGDYGPGTQRSRRTDRCHDITAYPELGLAGGACSGNGILLDISDPSNPVRIEDVADPNFAYWHSATFNNDGTTVLFTDEWGGGGAPRCMGSDLPTWGANAMFKLKDGQLSLAGYYKLPAPQTEFENCVAHNGSLIPVPGRDIKAQAWYQGGLSVFDFTDPANAYEIAYFDRGPISTSGEGRLTGGYWSTYWYNGHIYGSEIVRGMDVFALQPSEHLSQNEINAAKLVMVDELNPQNQMQYSFPMHPSVAKAYIDQLVRAGEIAAERQQMLYDLVDEGNVQMASRVAQRLERQALQNLSENNAGHWDVIRVRLLEQLRALGS